MSHGYDVLIVNAALLVENYMCSTRTLFHNPFPLKSATFGVEAYVPRFCFQAMRTVAGGVHIATHVCSDGIGSNI